MDSGGFGHGDASFAGFVKSGRYDDARAIACRSRKPFPD
jgi:hypothetical protein